ncbi:MAG: TetR/AcrR family transcriptional regulator [Chloroherpetonaceae bacterium]
MKIGDKEYKRKTKEKIILAAEGLFARFGLNKTTVDEIAKISHVAKGTIYHYFQSKEEIFEEVIEKEAQYFNNILQKNLDDAETPLEKLRAYVITQSKYVKELTNYYSALRDEYLSSYTFIEKIRKNNFENQFHIIKSILEQGSQKKIFAVADINLTASAIITALKGLEYKWTIGEQLQDIEKNIDMLLNLLFRGIEVR